MVVFFMGGCAKSPQTQADLILHGARVVTVDKDFSVREAIAIKDGKVLKVGRDSDILKLKGAGTEVVDLKGRMVLPGLMDSHVHPGSASMTEFDHAVPTMETVGDVLEYIRGRAEALGEGKWVNVSQVFITRLREQRYPTREELDRVAPKNPVVFSTGPDASLNSLAMKLSGIDRNFQISDGGPGFVEKDGNGEPTGILRSCTRYVKSQDSGRQATEADRYRKTAELFHDYNSVGITSIGDRNAGAEDVRRYQKLLADGKLTVRISVSRHIDTIGPMEGIQNRIREVAKDPLRKHDPMLQIIGIKTFLDGGMLTGSAYMRKPWGVSEIYAIRDPEYRGVLFIPRERLLPIVKTTLDGGMQFTAHSVGDGAVHTLLDVYEELNRGRPVKENRPCITHSNFMSEEAVAKCAQLGVCVDIQPAWLYLDTRTLAAQFGYERLRWFQPLKSLFAAGAIAGGGSDHMQKVGSLRSINPYNPFLAMQTAITRRARWYEGQLHPEEAISREQAIRFYTSNNAYLLFREDEAGTLEVGKRADLIVVDRDLLKCGQEEIGGTKVMRTYLDGKLVYDSASGPHTASN
ncbi:MAG TPA: amidohydrolase [Tepidisphaeraceae bacterium]|nr:amidohydrolase [Tepidisphaeraceae bacterium]